MKVHVCILDEFGRGGSPFPQVIGAADTRERAQKLGTDHFNEIWSGVPSDEKPVELEWKPPTKGDPRDLGEKPHWYAEHEELLYYVAETEVKVTD
jgi:hypothetical protein